LTDFWFWIILKLNNFMEKPLLNQPFLKPGLVPSGGWGLRILPPNPALEVRNDPIFIAIFLAVVLVLIFLAIFKIKIFGYTLGEYLKPIWYFVLVSLGVVFWQYQEGVTTAGNPLPIQISQWIWELMVALSAYKLAKNPGFGYANMFFLGVLYSILIHGSKVSIRYFFYGRTFWYLLDRFLYGSLIVMALAFVLGSVFVYDNRRHKS